MEIVSHQGPSRAIADEASEPLALCPRLVRQLVEFARTSLRPKRSQNVVLRHQPGLVQPVQESIAIVDPVNDGIDRRGDRVQEIQAGRASGMKIAAGRSSILAFLTLLQRYQIIVVITGYSAVDKLLIMDNLSIIIIVVTTFRLFGRREGMSRKDVSIVLVHGAWADGSSWAKVIAPLAAEGFKVVAAPLPLTSFADDVGGARSHAGARGRAGRSRRPCLCRRVNHRVDARPEGEGARRRRPRSLPMRAKPSPMCSTVRPRTRRPRSENCPTTTA